MDVTILVALIGILSGIFGYWFTTFFMQPILRYKNLRNKVLKDFIYYAQVINAGDLNGDMKTLYRERILSNRKSSAELTAAVLDLPPLYLKYLKFKKLNPADAGKHLVGFSNTNEYDQSNKIEALIRKQLGLPEKT